MKPLVSIIIPTYNRSHLIGETLDSVIAQTFSNWECIIIDDRSDDYTEELINLYKEKDPRIKFFQRPPEISKGAAKCRNIGIQNSSGDFIQFLDSDDLLASNKLEEQLKILGNKKNSISICKWGYFNLNKDAFKRVKYHYNSYGDYSAGIDLLEKLGENNEFLPAHAYLISMEIIKKCGLWDENLSNNDDAEFMTRILLKVSNICMAYNTVVCYRYNNTASLSHINNKEKIVSAIRSWTLIEKHIQAVFPTLMSEYVLSGKRVIYKTIKNSYPELVKKNFNFFKPILPFYKQILGIT
ncbi:glycosyltransferase family 2 protein [Salegentibacter sp. HM20]